jgi:4-amino-4-deoxy-L-arabinose transferase-like glycosyltransferase
VFALAVACSYSKLPNSKLETEQNPLSLLLSGISRTSMATSLQPLPTTTLPAPLAAPSRSWPWTHLASILALWFILFAASIATPPLLDDADATHAQAAQAMLATGDLVTLHVDGLRYLEKAPLPYWLAALSLKLFTSPRTLTARAAFAIHLPLALTVLGLALLGYAWSRRAFGSRAALYTALFTLTSAGVFLFTRIFIPDALLSLLLAATLYSFLRALEPIANSRTTVISTEGAHLRRSGEIPAFPALRRTSTLHAHLFYLFLALAILTKGLVALVLFAATAALFLALTGQFHRWRQLAPITGPLLLLAVAAPWHILAGLRNTGGAGGHGFFWFYFINEHVLRFLGRRIPRDYNKLPTALYWTLHLVWLFPWSLFAPAAILAALRRRRDALAPTFNAPTFAARTILLLCIFSALLLVFFSLSTNQEYYTFPAYLPLLMLLAAALANPQPSTLNPEPSCLTLTYAALTLTGLLLAAALGYGLFAARHLPFVADIGAVLAHRGVGDYTLSLSHFFDLTGPSFAALRLPATLAAATFAIGPPIAWTLHHRRRPHAAVLTVVATSTVFLLAAHIALVRFAPMLSSQDFAIAIQALQHDHRIAPDTQVLLYGDQAFGSSIPFYLQHHVALVDGRSTSMLFGSTFPDAPPIFLTPTDLAAQWGTGPRKLLFIPTDLTPTQRTTVDHLFLPHATLLRESSGKLLFTDRPLDPPHPTPSLASGIWQLEADRPNPSGGPTPASPQAPPSPRP